MRRLPLAALVIVAAGCSHNGRDPSAPRPGIGVLVQATAGLCTTVLVGNTPRRVCAPAGKGAAPADTATPDTARVSR